MRYLSTKTICFATLMSMGGGHAFASPPTYDISTANCALTLNESYNRYIRIKINVDPNDPSVLEERESAIKFLMPIINSVLDYCKSKPKDVSYRNLPIAPIRSVLIYGDQYKAEYALPGGEWLNGYNPYRERHDIRVNEERQNAQRQEQMKRQQIAQQEDLQRQRDFQQEQARRQKLAQEEQQRIQQAQFEERNARVAVAQGKMDRIKTDRSLQMRRFGHAIDGVVTLDSLAVNPYAYKNKVVLIRATFNRMEDANTASFGTMIAPLHTTETPSNQFTVPGQNVWLAMQVGESDAPVEVRTNSWLVNLLASPDAHIVKPGINGRFVGAYVCRTMECLDVADD